MSLRTPAVLTALALALALGAAAPARAAAAACSDASGVCLSDDKAKWEPNVSAVDQAAQGQAQGPRL
ncbi:hypothetical protein [Nannocystis pusilla]|uniref:hypothetical protein n=1 Tax=Nannocystis pusilla TaxID=889268 RepID=UPI003DA45D75